MPISNSLIHVLKKFPQKFLYKKLIPDVYLQIMIPLVRYAAHPKNGLPTSVGEEVPVALDHGCGAVATKEQTAYQHRLGKKYR